MPVQRDSSAKKINELQVVDIAESLHPKVLALFKNGEVDHAVYHGRLPGWFEKGLPKLYKKIVDDEPPVKGTEV